MRIIKHMQIVESKLRQTVHQLLKEEVYGTIATVQHGSRQGPADFIKTFENESGLVKWQVNKGAGSMYGHGLYTVWSKTDHQTYRGGYGNWIYKFKVNLYGFIIFDKAICEKVYGSSLSPAEQLKKIGKKQLLNRFNAGTKAILEEPPADMKKSSAIAAATSKYLAGNVSGIVFFGSNDGPVVLIYDPNIVTPMSYAKLEDAKNDIWTKWNPAKIKHSLSRSVQAGTIADPERLQKAPVINSEKVYEYLQKANYNNPANVKRLKESDYATKISLTNDALTPSATLKILSDEDDSSIRSNIARRIDLSEDLLIKLANDKDQHVRADVALNRTTPKEVLLRLAEDDDYYVKSHLVSNFVIYESENFDILEKLSDSHDSRVLIKIAEQSKTPPEILTKLSNNLDGNVCHEVALNRNTPLETIIKLSSHESHFVRRTVSARENLPKYLLIKLADDPAVNVRYGVASNDNAPVEALEKLINSDNPRILMRIAGHKNATKEMLMKLSNSSVGQIRLAAIRNLKNLNLAEQRIRQIVKLIAI